MVALRRQASKAAPGGKAYGVEHTLMPMNHTNLFLTIQLGLPSGFVCLTLLMADPAKAWASRCKSRRRLTFLRNNSSTANLQEKSNQLKAEYGATTTS